MRGLFSEARHYFIDIVTYGYIILVTVHGICMPFWPCIGCHLHSKKTNLSHNLIDWKSMANRTFNNWIHWIFIRLLERKCTQKLVFFLFINSLIFKIQWIGKRKKFIYLFIFHENGLFFFCCQIHKIYIISNSKACKTHTYWRTQLETFLVAWQTHNANM